jgi:SAM-dependent methyltransferase
MSGEALFDRRLLRRRRERAAAGFGRADFLVREAALRLGERLGDVRRRFETALLLGSHGGRVKAALPADRIGRLVETDLALALAGDPASRERLVLVADEEALPFGADRFDLVLACWTLHWANDLPGVLAQIRYTLKPDGLFLAILPGAGSLQELRDVLLQAELDQEGGAGPRVAPFVELADAGGLLQRAGFALPVADIETMTVTYAEPLKLLRELNAMAEGNVLRDRRPGPLRRGTVAYADQLYRARFAGPDGRLPATFELLTLSGWKPDPSQPQPIRRGSGQANLAKALGVPAAILEGKKPRD